MGADLEPGTENVARCLLCGSQGRQQFDRRQFRSHHVTNQRCLNCGLVYQSPRMTASALQNFYAEDYRALYQGIAEPSRKDLLIQAGRAEFLLALTRDRIPTPARHLDIGASAGVLMSRFRSHFGCDSYGVEPGVAYRQHAQGLGLPVYSSLEELAQHETDPFDLITMAHVLEHLPDPVGYLAALRIDYLAPEGWLLIEVPNLYAHDCFEVAHLVCFSAHTLKQAVQKAGYRVAHFQLHGQPRSVVLPLYLTLLARPDKVAPAKRPFVVQGEGFVALKRRLGMYRRRLLQRLFPSLAWLPTP